MEQALFAQPPADDADQLQQAIENVASESDADFENESYLDELSAYRETPLDLNTATEDQLHELGLLSGELIQSLMMYRQRHGALLTLYELQAVPFFDPQTISSLLPYVTVEPSRQTPIRIDDLRDGLHDLFLRYEEILERSAGYLPDSFGYTAYPGSPARVYIRYRYNLGRRIQCGFTAEKDPGEEFFDGSQRTVDYLSAHLFLRDLGSVKALAVGDYQVNIGQGLAMWSGFGIGKGVEPVRARRGGHTLSPYASVNENRFLRGAATTMTSESMSLTVFGSLKRNDANVTEWDSLTSEAAEISSFQETGYHRTFSELADKDALRHAIAGIEWQLHTRRADVGLYGVYHRLSAELNRSDQPYNQFRFSGDALINYGMHYTLAHGRSMLFGEVAFSDNGGLAVLNALQTMLDSRTAIVVLHRHYDRDYHSLMGSAFSEVSEPANEHGVYAGLRTNLSRKLTLEGYADFYRHPWLRFAVDAPSQGQEYFARITYRPTYTTELYVRLRYETKLDNAPGSEAPIDVPVEAQKLAIRVHWHQAMTQQLGLRSRVEWSVYDPGLALSAQRGFLAYQDIIWSVPKARLRLYGRFAMFDTDSYDTRIYAYENDVLYDFSIPAFYGKGTRVYVMARFSLSKSCDVWLRMAQTYFEQVESISSGYDEIQGQTKTEAKVQLRVRL